MDIEQQAGRVLLAGCEQSAFDQDLDRLLGEVRPAGLVFFQRNVAGAGEFAEFVQEVREHITGMLPDGAVPLLAVDQEGGTVDRFRKALAPFPAPAAVAHAADDLFVRSFGALAGRTLAAFGLNVNFAPVFDLSTPESETVMAGRVVSGDPQQVVRFARNFLEGMTRHDVFGCGKHFPGLGSAATDTHFEMASVVKNADELWEQDIRPFRELHDDLLMMMVNHAWYPALHPEGAEPRPASRSREIVTGLLRERIGFRGVVVADDLEMGGALGGRSVADAAVAAMEAGCDLLPVCRLEQNVRAARLALIERARSDQAFAARLEEAAGRIEVLQRALAQTASPRRATDWETLAADIRAAGETARYLNELAAAAPRFAARSGVARRPSGGARPGGGRGGPRGSGGDRGPRRERGGSRGDGGGRPPRRDRGGRGDRRGRAPGSHGGRHEN